MDYKDFHFRVRIPRFRLHAIPRWILPSPGNVLFTLLVLAGFLWATSAGALSFNVSPTSSPSTSTIPYQGRLADSAGNPITAATPMSFRLYAAGSGGTPLWTEQWTGSNSVQVSDGLFNVMLGSLDPISQAIITGNNNLWLGITVGADNEMTPRVQLGSVPWAMQALTVPDGSISTAKIANGAVTQVKLGADVSLIPPDGSITTAKIADGAITTAKLLDGAVTQYQDVSGSMGATTSSTSFVDLPGRSVTLTTGGGAVIVLFSGSHASSAAGIVGYWQIVRDNTVVLAYNNASYNSADWNTITMFGIDKPTAGTHTYKVQWRTSAGTLSASQGVYSENFVAIELRR